MDALGMSVIEIKGPVGSDLLLEGTVHGVDIRVLVGTVKNANAAKTGEWINRRTGTGRATARRRSQHSGPGRCGRKSLPDQVGIDEKGLLLYAIGRDRSDLRQHILPCVEHAKACPDDRSPVLGNVPCKSYPRLPHSKVVWDRAIGREARVIEKDAVRRVLRVYYRVREDLCFPAKAVIKRKIRKDLPFVLSEYCIILVLYFRRTCSVGRRAGAAGTL